MIKQIFREYDIRGIYKSELNESSVKAIGLALGRVMMAKGTKTLSVGHDARTHARQIFSWLVSGLNLAGLKVYDIGLVPTPVGYFSVFTGRFDANVMITGSHNPKEYNGFKITIGTDSYFGEDLQLLYKDVAWLMDKNEMIPDDESAIKFDIKSEYVNYLKEQFSHLFALDLDIVIDCGNGAAGEVVTELVKGLNLKAKVLHPEPDGEFPNHHPDPSEKENLVDLQRYLDNNKAELGFGFDGDADRIAVLSKDKNIKGDELAYLYSLAMKNPRILGEVKCSQNIYDALNKRGSKSFMGKTGHSNIKKAMKELDIDLAAEVSGHIFFKERYFGFDDAIYAMLRVLELVYNGINLKAELDKLPIVYSTDEIKFQASEESKFKIIKQLKQQLENGQISLPQIKEVIDIDGVRVRFERGWALVRASNTTPVIVMRFEADTKALCDELAMKFVSAVKAIKEQL
ncbi:phosphomannomutase/phosphoglucomutase [Campylobacter sp. 19-13652]|uniref:phosphomannomutase/phosphoglucomutase n=1 Tax=Campylobacter sp. 19-13652 TaxID=2840180 RepID=UPI001C788F50|nr:phosphomannomutase/phosphoglucomutase [Campylobacter sp. 19-13652]BCX79494.1 phospho-sugar mutase [Campylobacter sp. 19-13652]